MNRSLLSGLFNGCNGVIRIDFHLRPAGVHRRSKLTNHLVKDSESPRYR
jgi:hypothetical protein